MISSPATNDSSDIVILCLPSTSSISSQPLAVWKFSRVIPSGIKKVTSPRKSESVSSFNSIDAGSIENSNGSPSLSRFSPEPLICKNCIPTFVRRFSKVFAALIIGDCNAVTTPTVGSPSRIPFHPLVTPASKVNSGILIDNRIGVSSPIEVPIPPRFSNEVMI